MTDEATLEVSEDMKKEELLRIADERGVDVPSGATKAEIVALLTGEPVATGETVAGFVYPEDEDYDPDKAEGEPPRPHKAKRIAERLARVIDAGEAAFYKELAEDVRDLAEQVAWALGEPVEKKEAEEEE